MIIRHDRRDRESLVDPCKWPAITTFFHGNGAASLIAPTWLLTAAHVARALPAGRPFSVELVEKRYAIVRTLLHPGYDAAWEEAEEDEVGDAVDLALVELAEPVVGVEPYDLYTSSEEVGQECLLLGAGQYGDGLRGVRGSDHQLRRVTNVVDEAGNYWLKFRFDAPPDGTELEGVCGGGDSGGPAFIQANGSCCWPGLVRSNARAGNRWASMAASSIIRASLAFSIGYAMCATNGAETASNVYGEHSIERCTNNLSVHCWINSIQKPGIPGPGTRCTSRNLRRRA